MLGTRSLLGVIRRQLLNQMPLDLLGVDRYLIHGKHTDHQRGEYANFFTSARRKSSVIRNIRHYVQSYLVTSTMSCGRMFTNENAFGGGTRDLLFALHKFDVVLLTYELTWDHVACLFENLVVMPHRRICLWVLLVALKAETALPRA